MSERTMLIRALRQSAQIRRSLRLPLHRLGAALLPLLPNGPPAVPPPLPARLVLRHPPPLRRLRCLDVDFAHAVPVRRCSVVAVGRDCELQPFEPVGVWHAVDEEAVRECEVVEDVGFLVVCELHVEENRSHDADNCLQQRLLRRCE